MTTLASPPNTAQPKAASSAATSPSRYSPLSECQAQLIELVSNRVPEDERTPDLKSMIVASSGRASISLDAEKLREMVVAIPHALKAVKAAAHLHMAELFLARGADEDNRRVIGALDIAQHVNPDALCGRSEEEWCELTKVIVALRSAETKLAPGIGQALRNFRDLGRGEVDLAWSGKDQFNEPRAAGIKVTFSKSACGTISIAIGPYIPTGFTENELLNSVDSFTGNSVILERLLKSMRHVAEKQIAQLNPSINSALAKAQNELAEFLRYFSNQDSEAA